jgi:ATP synthase protein I
LATLIVSALAVMITALVFDPFIAGSVLVGALAGVLYLRLLARSVSKLGNGSKKVGKLQLLVPVVLVLAAARLPQLELLPAILGFLLYKPALILQAVLDS